MNGLNKVMLLGNLGADADLRYTQSGHPVLNLRIATTETYLDANRVRHERTEWHSVTVWGKRGEGLARVLAKGSRIFVEGGLRTSSYEDRDGTKRYRTEIVANEVILAGGARAGGQPDEGSRRFTPPALAEAERGLSGSPPQEELYGDQDHGDQLPF